ncbi:serine/threonine-protein kinase [Enhygromyxa salina]|uniref:serine/threonine-protein kinase n=1 Tax=Enhygromyxa salina TaxID=215803 RepID=UPI0015E7469C|nr:serine/threonine-protein kinase [Enhygromyxa salina]
MPLKSDPHAERTLPQPAAGASGPTHAQLRAVGEGRSPPLILADRYRVERRLGRGGMAMVYAGRLLSIDRTVAIKILNEDHRYRDDRLARFVAEAHMTSHLRHPNIVDVLDFGSTQEGVVFMVMELLEGEDLRAMVRRDGPLPWPRVQSLMRDICSGLSAAHHAGLVHRDLKPANCFYVDDTVKLLDFGVATHSSVSAGERMTSVEDDPTQTLDPGWTDQFTGDRRVIGTPEYMSPEQAQGHPVDARSDIYAAGILLGELLTGRVPFESTCATGVISAQIFDPPPTLQELGGEEFVVVEAIEAIYARALSKAPDDRFATIEAFAAAIAAVVPVTMHPRWWRRPGVMAAATTLAGLLAVMSI